VVSGADPGNPGAACSQAFAEGLLTSNLLVNDVVLETMQDGTATFAVSLTLGQDGTAYTEMVNAVHDAGVWKISLIY
jgi:hypothetical protein